MPKPSNTGLKNISAKTHNGEVCGYQVAVQWNHKRMYAWIPGDDEVALEEAKTIRHIFEHELGKPRTELHIIGTAVGVVRVGREKVWGAPVWMAYIWAHGHRYATQFSIAVWGEDGAREKALEWRKQKELELHV